MLHSLPGFREFLATFGRTSQEDPLKTFAYRVEIDNFARMGFSKVTGLKPKVDVVTYREGGDNTTEKKSPGMTKWDDLTLERGIIVATGAGDRDFVLWFAQVYDVGAKKVGAKSDFRRNIDIVLLDREGKTAKRWRVLEAWPSGGVLLPDLDALGSNNAIESLTITHEGAREIL